MHPDHVFAPPIVRLISDDGKLNDTNDVLTCHVLDPPIVRLISDDGKLNDTNDVQLLHVFAPPIVRLISDDGKLNDTNDVQDSHVLDPPIVSDVIPLFQYRYASLHALNAVFWLIVTIDDPGITNDRMRVSLN